MVVKIILMKIMVFLYDFDLMMFIDRLGNNCFECFDNYKL